MQARCWAGSFRQRMGVYFRPSVIARSMMVNHATPLMVSLGSSRSHLGQTKLRPQLREQFAKHLPSVVRRIECDCTHFYLTGQYLICLWLRFIVNQDIGGFYYINLSTKIATTTKDI